MPEEFCRDFCLVDGACAVLQLSAFQTCSLTVEVFGEDFQLFLKKSGMDSL